MNLKKKERRIYMYEVQKERTKEKIRKEIMKERKKKENITTSKKETKGFSLGRKKER